MRHCCWLYIKGGAARRCEARRGGAGGCAALRGEGNSIVRFQLFGPPSRLVPPKQLQRHHRSNSSVLIRLDIRHQPPPASLPALRLPRVLPGHGIRCLCVVCRADSAPSARGQRSAKPRRESCSAGPTTTSCSTRCRRTRRAACRPRSFSASGLCSSSRGGRRRRLRGAPPGAAGKTTLRPRPAAAGVARLHAADPDAGH